MNSETRVRSRFFVYMAYGFLAVALTGFSTTFFLPLAQGSFDAPAVVHVHGLLLFGWLLFFLAQAHLIAARRVVNHRQLGWAGAGLAAAVVISGIAIGFFATRRDLAAGGGDFARGQFVNILIEMLTFGALVAAAVVFRHDRETHKRLLLLATISVLAPAWLRFRHLLPWVPNPFVVFSIVADAVLLLAVAQDLRVRGRVHPAYIWAGGAMVAVHVTELLASGSALWLRIARLLLGESG